VNDAARTPVIVGVAQHRWRGLHPATAPDVAVRAAGVARAAADDTGIGHRAIADVDAWVHVVGWQAQNPTDLIARLTGSQVRHHFSSGAGGEVGVVTANWAARAIARGELDSVMVTGGTDYRTRMKAAKLGIDYRDPQGGEGTHEVLVPRKPASTDIEIAHRLEQPIEIYPVFENALRAKKGRTIEEHRRVVGELMSSFTAVAATNPHAWFPVERSADDLTTPTADNRMIGFPYTKRLNAILDVDLNGAYLMMSEARARSLGISPDRFVYWWGGGSAVEVAYYPSERPDLAATPSMQRSHRAALREAGIGIDDVDLIDFYSCFPVAVEMACEMLGLDTRDPRRFTLTGGLPYAGGPGSAYTMHSIAAMVDRVRERPEARAFVTGNGMWLSKHASSVWSGRPRPASPTGAPPPDGTDLPEAPLPVAARPEGDGVIEGYTVLHDRAGEPAIGVVIGRLGDGERFVANVHGRDALVELETVEGVGRHGTVRAGDPTNTFELS
jgi:acetyl-CoA C-acetyltransferase